MGEGVWVELDPFGEPTGVVPGDMELLSGETLDGAYRRVIRQIADDLEDEDR